MNHPPPCISRTHGSAVAPDSRVPSQSCSGRVRQRVTIDLRGIGSELQAEAVTRGQAKAAIVRAAVVAMLAANGDVAKPDHVAEPVDNRKVKVTVRMGVTHAMLLSQRARRVGVSKGAYLAGLLDGQPPVATAADHGAAVAALADSTQRVAAMSADIRALLRSASLGSIDEAPSRATLTLLSHDVQAHLQIASRLVAALTSRAGSNGSVLRASHRGRPPT